MLVSNIILQMYIQLFKFTIRNAQFTIMVEINFL